MEIIETVWIIMSKDRTLIAKGVPRNRYLVKVDAKDKKRILTYTSKKMTENGYLNNWFYGASNINEEDLEAVEATLTIKI